MHKIKHLKLYALAQNEKTKFLENIIKEHKTVLDEFIDLIFNLDGIHTVILYGKEEKDKANLLIIGENVDNIIIRDAIVSIKVKHSFTITHLVLTLTQYQQMAAMNLYPGVKTILLEK